MPSSNSNSSLVVVIVFVVILVVVVACRGRIMYSIYYFPRDLGTKTAE